MPKPSKTVRANFPMASNKPNPVVIKVGMTNPSTPMGANAMMNLVSERSAAFRLSQNRDCALRSFLGSFDTKNPNNKEKKMSPNN